MDMFDDLELIRFDHTRCRPLLSCAPSKRCSQNDISYLSTGLPNSMTPHTNARGYIHHVIRRLEMGAKAS